MKSIEIKYNRNNVGLIMEVSGGITRMWDLKPMQKIKLSLYGFGIVMGLIFPLYTRFVLKWTVENQISFNLGCIIAGYIVGHASYCIVKVILDRLDRYYKETLSKELGICPVDIEGKDKDRLRNMQEEFEKLLRHYTAMKREVEEKNRILETKNRALVESEQKIKQLAYHDPVTDLPNRRFGKQLLERAIDGAQSMNCKVGVLFIDLDRFKGINDTLGHNVGDILLKRVAKNLKECIRERDSVIRLGGDEFMVVLHRLTALEDLYDISGRIIETISEPFEFKEAKYCVTCSVGIALYPDHGSDVEKLLINSDIAMYSAKDHGRNNYKVFEKDMLVKQKVRQKVCKG